MFVVEPVELAAAAFSAHPVARRPADHALCRSPARIGTE